MPSLYELFGYVVDPVTNLGGPFYEFSYYRQFIHKTGVWTKIPLAPFTAFLRWARGFLFIAFYVISFENGFEPIEAADPSFMDRSYSYKVLFYFISAKAVRAKYYSMFMFQSGNLAASGLSYSGSKDGKETWDTIVPVRVLGVELSQNF